MTVTEPDYQPYQPGPFRWRLGLRPLEIEDWIQIGPDYLHEIDAKRDLLERVPGTVLCHLDGIEDEAREVLDDLVAHLCRMWPDSFSTDGTAVTNHRTGEVFALDGSHHPLDIAGRLVQEDLALLVVRDGRLVFGGGSVCFPNRWDLPSKLGRTMAEVHAPVSQLNEQLEAPIDAFFDRLRPGKDFWRLGWGVLVTDEPYQATDGTAPPRPPLPTPDRASDALFVRVERETLRRFPRTECVLFTIRTYIRPLGHLDDRPDEATRLTEALLAMPDDVADYKAVVEIRPVVAEWLTRLTGTDTNRTLPKS